MKQLKEQLGKNLISVIETTLPAQTIVVVEKLDFIVVDILRDCCKEKPVVFSVKELEEAKDVFAVDFLSIKSDYKVVYGKDILKNIILKKEHVRHQLEFELRSKLITLRQRYMVIEKPEELLGFTIPTLVPLFRAMLYLKDQEIPGKPVTLLEKVFKHTGVSSQVLLDLAKGKKVQTDRIGEIMQTLSGFIEHNERL